MFIHRKDSVPTVLKAELFRVNEEHLAPQNGVIETLEMTGLATETLDNKTLATRLFGNPNLCAVLACRPDRVLDQNLALGLMRLNDRIQRNISSQEQDILGTNLTSVVLGQYIREKSLCDFGEEILDRTITYRPDILGKAITEMKKGEIPYMRDPLVEKIVIDASRRARIIRARLVGSEIFLPKRSRKNRS